MAGMLITSIVGGQIVSRTGKYRVFPIVGTAIITVGLFLLSGLSPETSTLQAAGFMFVTGFGIGLVMQVLVVAVQNAVGYEDLGVATSGNTLFRNIGSSVGTAVIGTIFATELASRLRSAFPHASASQLNTSHLSSATLALLPPDIRAACLAAFAGSLDTAFKVAGFVSIIAFVASWFIKELPMRTTVTTEDLGSADDELTLSVGGAPAEDRERRPERFDPPVAASGGRSGPYSSRSVSRADGKPTRRQMGDPSRRRRRPLETASRNEGEGTTSPLHPTACNGPITAGNRSTRQLRSTRRQIQMFGQQNGGRHADHR